MAVEKGQKAIDFTLPDTENKRVSLSKELGRGPVVLAFYPLAFTSVCTSEMCSFRDNYDLFRKAGAKVFGISIDSPFTNGAWKKQNNLNFILLSDFNKEVISKYGVMHEELAGLRGVAKRSIFVLDKDGVVRYKWVTDDPKVAPNVLEIAEEIRKLTR